jgi:hypothetical protein
MFPDLKADGRRASSALADSIRPRRKRRATDAQRRAGSENLKNYWAKRRQENAANEAEA